MSAEKVDYDKETNSYIFRCPNCQLSCQVEKHDINCSIFRHAYFYAINSDGAICPTTQLNPHATKDVCDKLKEEGKILGCGKPFQLVKEGETYIVKPCDYI
jgi:hypothetical protein